MPVHPALVITLSAACGFLLALPFRSLDSSIPAWLALAPMFWLVARLESRRWAVISASLFSLCWTATSFDFLWHLTPYGVIALCIYTSLYYVAALMLIRKLARTGVVNAVVGTAALWVLVELARANIPVLAFPWLLLGHTLLYHETLRQSADLLGVYGLSFLIAAVNAVIAFALPVWLPTRWQPVPGGAIRSAWRAACLAAALLLGAFYYGNSRIAEISPRLKPGAPIGLIQGNIIQKLDRTDEEMTAQLTRHLELHREVIEKGKQSGQVPVLICWAETMVPGYLNWDAWGMTFRREVGAAGIPTLTGSNFYVPEDKASEKEGIAYNTAYLLNEKGEFIYHYYKRRLVPFGEYIPWVHRFPFLKIIRSVTRDAYVPGSDASPVHEIGGYKIALNICVEDIHPDIAREGASAGADTLVNITNDGWFYQNYGPRSHLQAAAFRAIEVRRPLLRVTNTGHTVAIDPLGRISELIPHETEGTAIAALLRIEPNPAKPTISGPRTLSLLIGDIGGTVVFSLLLIASILLRQPQSQPIK